MKKKFNWTALIYKFVLLSLLISTGVLMYLIIRAPSVADPSIPFTRIKGDYALMFTQCILGLVAINIPSILEKRLKVEIPSFMLILFVIFLYCSIFLGEVRSFYYTVPHWDTMLHTFSGGMIGALGYSIIVILNQTEKVPMNLSPLFVAIFAFSFAMTIGVFWEFYEFAFDGFLGLNMQKFALENGTQLIGRSALADTMKDLIVDGIGAFIISVIGYISLKYKKGWVEQWQLKVRREHHAK